MSRRRREKKGKLSDFWVRTLVRQRGLTLSDCFILQSCLFRKWVCQLAQKKGRWINRLFSLPGHSAVQRRGSIGTPSSSHADKVSPNRTSPVRCFCVRVHSTSGPKSSGTNHFIADLRNLSSTQFGPLWVEFDINKWHKASEHACTHDHKHSSFLLLELTHCCSTGGCGKQPVYPRTHKDSTQLCPYKLFQQRFKKKKTQNNPNIP